MRRLYAAIAISSLGLFVALPLGCDKPPAKSDGAGSRSGTTSDSSAGKSGSSENLSDSDKAALRSMTGGKNDAAGATGSNPGATAGGTGALPPGHPPIGGTAPGSVAPPPPGNPATDLKFEPPSDWKVTPPKSAMRKAQYAIPHGAGDADDGEVVVFFFGAGQGGGVGDNLTRWKGQFTAADGAPLPADAAKLESVDAGEQKITLLEVAGRFAPGAMPGMTDQGPRDNYRMVAGVIETPAGNWFVKATGPDATIAAQREAIRKFISSAKR